MDKRKQNKALRQFEQLLKDLAALEPLIVPVLLRSSQDSGVRKFKVVRGKDAEVGTPPPSYADPTGESGIREGFIDAVEAKVCAIAKYIELSLNLARNVLTVTPPDVAERAKREIPDCLACGDPVSGRLKSGYDEKCYKAWQRAGYPDRPTFERSRREKTTPVEKVEYTDWRVDAVDDLQGSNVLPLQRQDLTGSGDSDILIVTTGVAA